LGGYRVLGRLGEGGQGTVYLAEALEGGRVAVKVLHPHHALDENAHRRFVREVEAARRVAGFSTARVIEVDMAGDRPYIVSEYVEGVSLDVRVRERGVLSEDELVRLALGTANALAAIHAAGVVHRDFKPSNVLLGPDGPRVIDFGIARALDSFTVTSSGIIGTPTYMSPEQISDKPVGAAADIFSWASTMVFAATGRSLFQNNGVPAVLYSILTAAPDLAGVPTVLRPVLERCLAKDPEQRPTAADIMLHLVGQTPTRTDESTFPISPRRKKRRVVALMGAVLAVAISAGAWLWPSASSDPGPLPTTASEKSKVGFVMDVGGRHDGWFNESALPGIARAQDELGLSVSEVEAVVGEAEAAKTERLRALAQSGHDPIVTIGFPYTQAVKTVAAEFPKVRFAIVDSGEMLGPNVTNLVFNEQEAGYLAGAAVALASKKKAVGFIGAVKGDLEIERAAAGFAAGVKAVDAGVRIDTVYVSAVPDYSGYDDRKRAGALADRLFRTGDDVVFQAAHNSNLGITRAAGKAGALVIGADADESKGVDAELRRVFVTSIIKRIDVVVFDYLRSAAEGRVRSGPKVYGVKAGALDYLPTGTGLPAIRARLDEIKRRMAAGAS
jgi:basic membrane lipoprotein Med (substrate-binding protein (PBP1-ABC) superfamily)